jgi:hypothetical protein
MFRIGKAILVLPSRMNLTTIVPECERKNTEA